MLKLLLIYTLCVVTLSACEKQKQASAEVGTVPKQMMDKTTNDLNNAQALKADKLKVLENDDAPADADEKIDCSGVSFSEARSLAELPAEVGALMGKDRLGLGGIADRNGKFNITDALMLGEQLPFRRLGLAAVSADCILVAIEHGGISYSVELWVFKRNDGQWRSEKRKNILSVPSSLQKLIAHASK